MLLDTYNQVFLWIGHSATKEEKEKSSTFAQTYITESSIRDGRSTDTAIVTVYAGKEPLFFTCHFLGWDSSGKAAFEDPYAKRRASLDNARHKSFSSEPVGITPERLSARAAAIESAEKSQQQRRESLKSPAAYVPQDDEEEMKIAERRANAVKKSEEDQMKRRVSLGAVPGSPPPPVPPVGVSVGGSSAPPTPTTPGTAAPDYLDPSSNKFNLDELKSKLPGVNPTKKELYLKDSEFEVVFKMDPNSFSSLPKWKQMNAKKQAGLF